MSIASASTTVKFHEFPSGAVLHNYQPGTQIDGPIRSISWSKDGNWLALVPHSGSVEILSVKDQLKLIHTIQGIEEPSCAAFQNTTKKNIAVGTQSGQVLVYDIKARNVKKRFPRATSTVTRVAFTVKDGHVAAACESGEAFLYSNVTNSLSGTFKIPRSRTISALRTNPIKRNYVAAGSDEGVVAVWDMHANKNKFFMGAHKAPVTAVAFSPVNSDLVVSTGLDRQLCFYDIGANKCVGNIFVENSMGSVDFSPDGKFVVVGSQKGRIYVYDSKNIQQPVHSFAAHNGSVNHLSFRKSEDYENSFISSEETKVVEENQRSNQSFDTYFMQPGGGDKTNAETSRAFSETADSFLVAMGLDHDNTADSTKPECRASDSSKKFLMHKLTPTVPSKIIQEKMLMESKTSTPNCVPQELNSPISPIVDLDGAKQNKLVNLGELQEFIKDTVKDELKIVSEELKNELKYYSTHNLTQMRQMSLDMLMSMVKEFIKIENNFNGLRAELVCDMAQNQNPLYEENLILKQRIAVLEEELSVLKNNYFNNNS